LVQMPEALNKHYFEIFERTLRSEIQEYDRSEKRFITPLGTAEAVSILDPTAKYVTGAVVGRWSDCLYFRGPLSLKEVMPAVEGAVQLLAGRLAASVETVTHESAAYGTPICYDLFKLSDDSPNLRTLYCVKGNDATLEDPTGSITGWFAYTVQFTVSTKS